MGKPVVSIVMGSFNQKDILKRVLDSYQDQSIEGAFEVLVMDSSSSDGTAELLDSYESNYVLRPFIIDNQGKAHARNRGVQEAISDLIIITDSDMIADSNFVKTHVDAHQNLVGESGYKDQCFEGVTNNMTHLHWPPEPDHVYSYIRSNYKNGKSLGFNYFLTGNISFPKSLFLEEGGFDESFKSYGWEDIELGYRLIYQQKVPLYYLKSAINYHYHVLTEDEEIVRHFSKGESAKRVVEKHPSLRSFLGDNILNRLLYALMRREERFYRVMHRWFNLPNGWRHRMGYYCLKEHQYLRGLYK